MGDRDQAFAWLERAVQERDAGLDWLRHDPTLREIHSDPRWKPLLRKMNLLAE